MEMKIFKNDEFGEIRTVLQNNEVWFVGKDVAEELGYAIPQKAIKDHVDSEDKKIIQKFQNGTLEIPNRGLTIINESGLYSLIFSSKLSTAKRFKHWVTSEVLPSIRKAGGYIAGQEVLSDNELLERALIVAQNRIKERERQIAIQNREIKEMQPKAVFADAVATTKNAILVGDLAKLICQNGVNIGQNRLFEWLRENGYLIKNKGINWNMPTQKSIEKKLFKIKETVQPNKYGFLQLYKVPLVTGKGQQYFINKFLSIEKNEKQC